ncbi:unnamed protein product, partial [marine sediment metagenome]
KDISPDPLAFLKPQYVSPIQREFFEKISTPKPQVSEVVDDRKWYEKSIEEIFISPAKTRVKEKFGAGISVIGTGFRYVEKRVHFDIGGTPSSPKLTIVYGKRDVPTIPEKAVKLGVSKLGEVKGDVYSWAVGKEKIAKLDLETSEKFQTQYQTAFEQKYLEDIQIGKTDFEKASLGFEQSAEAKKLQKDFEKEYGEEYKTLSQDAPLMKKIIG